MKIQVRKAKIIDIPSLIDKMFEFYVKLRNRGALDIAKSDSVLKGGVVIEIGNGFSNPNWNCFVAVKDLEVLAFIVGIIEFCSPISEYHKCVRIHADYQAEGSLLGPRLNLAMWSQIEEWAQEQGAGYYYANVHPGNQPSVRAVKHVKFKHGYTQFYRPVKLDVEVQ